MSRASLCSEHDWGPCPIYKTTLSIPATDHYFARTVTIEIHMPHKDRPDNGEGFQLYRCCVCESYFPLRALGMRFKNRKYWYSAICRKCKKEIDELDRDPTQCNVAGPYAE